MNGDNMILALTKIVGGISFNDAVALACEDEQKYIKCSGLPRNKYLQISKNTVGTTVCRYLDISDNLDILVTHDWTHNINIGAVLNRNWSVYQATIG